MTTVSSLQCFRVGGSVRDELMGLPAGDHDWVVVGATPGQMIALGFKPVGKDFPVFLHPRTHEEYALARTERKTGPGYKGFAVHFAPDVTLEDDLLRRDLTINAMAVPAAAASATPATAAPASTTSSPTRSAPTAPLPGLIDPFGGLADLRARIFRHVSPAFREDPVRILRLARFAARFADFSVADETLALMRAMSAAGEVDALVAERVWQEISRGLMSQQPSRMLEVLDDSHALAILLPPLSPVARHPAWLAALDASAAAHDPLPVRFAILLAGAVDDGPSTAPDTASQPAAARVEQLARRLRAPNDCLDAARRLAGEMPGPVPTAARRWLSAPERLQPDTLLALFNRHDAWRRPERLEQLLLAARRLAGIDTGASPTDRTSHTSPDNIQTRLDETLSRIRQALAAAQTVDTGTIAGQHAHNPQAIRHAIDAARHTAITHTLTRR